MSEYFYPMLRTVITEDGEYASQSFDPQTGEPLEIERDLDIDDLTAYNSSDDLDE